MLEETKAYWFLDIGDTMLNGDEFLCPIINGFKTWDIKSDDNIYLNSQVPAVIRPISPEDLKKLTEPIVLTQEFHRKITINETILPVRKRRKNKTR